MPNGAPLPIWWTPEHTHSHPPVRTHTHGHTHTNRLNFVMNSVADCLGALWPTTAIGQLARLAWVCTRDNSDERPLLVHVLNELRLLNRTTGVEKKKTLSPTQSVADGAGALGRKVSVRAGTLDWKSVRKDTKAWE